MNNDKRKKLEANTKNLLELLGEDPSREGLLNTPKRVAKAWDFLTKGYSENLDELIYRQNFVSVLKEVYRKNPFCYLPYFIESFMDGTSSDKLISTFHFSYSMVYYTVVKEILELTQQRFRKQIYPNALELNLKIPEWGKLYESIKDNYQFFEDELNELYFNSILQARLFLFLIISEDYFSKNDLLDFLNKKPEIIDITKHVHDMWEKNYENNKVNLKLKNENN